MINIFRQLVVVLTAAAAAGCLVGQGEVHQAENRSPWASEPRIFIFEAPNAGDRWLRVDVYCTCPLRISGTPALTADFQKDEDVLIFRSAMDNLETIGGGGLVRSNWSELAQNRSPFFRIPRAWGENFTASFQGFTTGGFMPAGATRSFFIATPTGDNAQLNVVLQTNRSVTKVNVTSGTNLIWHGPNDFHQSSSEQTYSMNLMIQTITWVEFVPWGGTGQNGSVAPPEPTYTAASARNVWTFSKERPDGQSSPGYWSHGEGKTVLSPGFVAEPGNYILTLDYRAVQEPTNRPYVIGLPIEGRPPTS